MSTETRPPFATLGLVPMVEPSAAGPEVASSLELLQSVYRDRTQPLSTRMRAAALSLPFEHPKLSVSANISAGFGGRMERLMSQRGTPAVIDANPRKVDVTKEND